MMCKYFKGLSIAALIAGAGLLGVASPARASIQIQLYEGVTLIYNSGVQAGNSYGLTPGTYGDFTIGAFGTISTSSNSPGTNLAQLQLANVFISTTGAHTLTVVASGDGFTSPVSPPDVFISSTASISNLSGTTSSGFTSSVGTGLLDTSIASAPTVDLSGSDIYSASGTTYSNMFGLSSSYALTIKDVITFGAGGGSITVNGGSDTVSSVPEPATLAMAFAGLPVAGLAWLRRRKGQA